MQSILPSSAAFSTLNHRMQVLLSDPQIQQAELSRLAQINADVQRDNIALKRQLQAQSERISYMKLRIENQDAANSVLQGYLRQYAETLLSVAPFFDQLQQAYEAVRVLREELASERQQTAVLREMNKQQRELLKDAVAAAENAERQRGIDLEHCKALDGMLSELLSEVKAKDSENLFLLQQLNFPELYSLEIPCISSAGLLQTLNAQIQRVGSVMHRLGEESSTAVKTLCSSCAAARSTASAKTRLAFGKLTLPSIDSSALEQRVKALATQIEGVQLKMEKLSVLSQGASKETRKTLQEQTDTIARMSATLCSYEQLLDLNNQKISAYHNLASTLQIAGKAGGFK